VICDITCSIILLCNIYSESVNICGVLKMVHTRRKTYVLIRYVILTTSVTLWVV